MPRRDAEPTTTDFLEYLSSPDELSMVLRAHIAVEASILALMEQGAIPTGLTELDRLSFVSRVDVAIALGAIGAEHRDSLRVLNEIRNRFAHRLTANLTEADIHRLHEALAPNARATIGGHFEWSDIRGGFRWCCIALIDHLQVHVALPAT